MAIYIVLGSRDEKLSLLIQEIASGKMQLPEFQRSWIRNDNKIINIWASRSHGYPMGANMCLETGIDLDLAH